MMPSHTRAIILAGGKGTRLRPLTAVFPKPLVPLGEKPIIDILLSQLSCHGFSQVTLSTGYLAELVLAVCGDGEKYGMDISYSRENQPLGTAGPIGLIDDLLGPVIVMNGDLLTTLNFSKMLDYHESEKADITIGCYKRSVSIDFGVIERDSNENFTGFKEKPTFDFDVSMGVNVLSSNAIRSIPSGKYMDMPDLILNTHANGGKISCYQDDCFWLDIGRMDDYGLAQKWFLDNRDTFLGKK